MLRIAAERCALVARARASQTLRLHRHCDPAVRGGCSCAMDKIDLSRKMRRFTVWLETKNQPDSLVRKKFHGAPFGDAYVTIDPECQTAAGDWVRAAEALGLIALFVIGAAFGSLIVLGRGVHRRPWVLLAEALLLAVAALCYALGLSNLAVAAIVTAMGL